MASVGNVSLERMEEHRQLAAAAQAQLARREAEVEIYSTLQTGVETAEELLRLKREHPELFAQIQQGFAYGVYEQKLAALHSQQ